MAELPREPGWYRLTEHGWEPVGDDQAQAEFTAMAPGYQDLAYLDFAPPAMTQDPLF